MLMREEFKDDQSQDDYKKNCLVSMGDVEQSNLIQLLKANVPQLKVF